MKKRYFGIVLAMLLGMAVLAGCGTDDSKEDKSSSEKKASTSTPTPTPISKVEKEDKKGLNKGDIYSIFVDMSILLEEYDEETGETGKIAKKRIQCGERYKLSLVGNGVKDRNALKKKGIDLIITIRFGQENTEESTVQFVTEFHEEAGVLNFVEEEPGVYVAQFQLTKENNMDFSKGYFVIGVDSMEGSNAKTEVGSITIEIEPILAEGDKDTVEIQINGTEVQRNDLTIVKGDLEFTEDDISYGVGQAVEKTTMNIKLPEQSQGVTIEFYMDEFRKEYYGTTEVLSPQDGQDTISVVLSKYLKQYMGEAKYEEILDKGGRKVYLTITAIGGKSYNDVSIDVDYVLK